MDLEYLTPSEFEIECSVRNITGPPTTKTDTLRLKLEDEKRGVVPSPLQPHDEALTRPRLEIEMVTAKLHSIRELFRSKIVKEKDETQKLVCSEKDRTQIHSRLNHIRGCLIRLYRIPSVMTKVTQLLDIWYKFFDITNVSNEDPIKLNELIQTLDTFDLDSNTSSEDPGEITMMERQISPVNNTINNVNWGHRHTTTHQTPIPGTSAEAQIYSQNLTYAQTPKTRDASKIRMSPVNENFDYPNHPTFATPHERMNPRSMFDPNMFSTPHITGKRDLISGYNGHAPKLMESSPPQGPNNSRIILAKEIRNLRFDGSVQGIPIERFLYRFEAIAFDYGIPVNRLIEEVHGFLGGAAQEYYWSCRENKPYITWPELRTLLRERFQDFRTDMLVKAAMEARKQRSGENFIDYYNDLLNMSAPLKCPMSSTELIWLVMKNMKSSLQFELASWIPSSLPELVQRCVNTEYTWKRLGAHPDTHVPRKHIHELEASCSFSGHISENPNFCPIPNEQSHPTTCYDINNIEAINRNTTSYVKCWNCGGGHRFLECDTPIKGIFCFGCGRQNVLKPNCPNCTNRNSGNQMGGMRTPGNPHLLAMTTGVPKPDMTESAVNTDPELYRMQYQNLKNRK